ncbi:assembly chaperone of RPL4 [Trichomonascus vanleenenianus]|uniref:Acl4p n=1 Tax=Trichomonascus vanleenenianus TaxID=2268995 RepID=UPI003ECB2AB0
MAEVLTQARALFEASEFEKCLDLLINNLDEENVQQLQLLGEAHLELGDPETAYKLLSRSAELDQNGAIGGLEKFLWLGQLSGDKPGLKWFEQGLEGLRGAMAKEEKEESIKMLRRKASEALCGMIEIWMTDLCMEPEAESQCEKLITEALMIDESVPESWSVLGSIRLSQQRDDDAKQALEKSWELFQAGIPTNDEVNSLVRLAQSMTEIDLYLDVLDVTTAIHRVNDQVPDAYYLNGLAHYNLYGIEKREGRERSANRHAMGAREAFTSLEHLAESEPELVDPEMVEDARQKRDSMPEVSEGDYSESEHEFDEEMEE